MTRSMKCMLIACLCFCIFPVARAATYTAASCAESDFQAAYNSASNGDIVQGPSGGGTAIWNATFTITKQITLNGNNGGACVITFGSSGHINVTAGTSYTTRITGFTMKQGSLTSSNISFTVTSSSLPYEFDHNTITDDGTQGSGITFLQLNGYGAGVVTSNSFTTAYGGDQMITVYGCTGPSDYTCLGKDIVPASSGMHYIENNAFTFNAYTSPAHSGPPYYFWGTQAMNTYYAAAFVFRYNTLSMVGIETHGSAPGTCSGHGGENSTRWWEIYNNSFTIPQANSNQSFYVHVRGGSGVIFGNTITNAGNNSASGGINLDEDCSSGTWPLQAQIGRGLNTTAGSTGTPGNYSPAYSWGQNASTFPIFTSNSTFVLYGTATNCSGHTGNVCDDVNTTSQPASLERCESAADVAGGCPMSYSYSPYTYPYPLTSGSSGGGPTPPSGLAAVVG